MSDLRTQLLAAFETEYREHMDALRHGLDALSSGREADIRELFRRAHSLKGAARAVDLPEVEELSHRLEAILSDLMDGVKTFDAATGEAVLALLDETEGEIIRSKGLPIPSVPERPAKAETPDAAEATPPASDDIPGDADAPVEFLRVASEQVEDLVASMHEFDGELDAQGVLLEQIDALRDELRQLERDMSRALGDAGLKADRGDALAVVERGIATASLSASRLSRASRRSQWSINHAASAIKESVEQIALVPASSVYGGFGHIIRDLARDEGHEVNVRITGGHVQADRRALQQLKDPVLHLVRNAIRHGAEAAGERERKGKSAELTITLAFRARGGRLILTVQDDGRGPDLARIGRTALERGLMQPDDTFVPSPDQLLSFVLEPGFSTSAEVDRISGRGMGLSVVAETVKRLNGSLQLQPARKGGLEVVLSVPLSTALQPVILVDVGDETYALPSFAIEKLVTIRGTQVEVVESRSVARIELGGSDVVVPIQPLSSLVTANAPAPLDPGAIQLAILRRGSRRLALAVSAFSEVRAMNVQSAEAAGITSPTIMGTVLLDRTRAALVLNPDGLMEHWLRNQARFASMGIGVTDEPTATEAATHTILVVDDSITTRTLQRSILESQGYKVLLSVDGLDALNTLRSTSDIIDLIIADVEMPRMDGFSLLQALKQDARFSLIPVIMMTSRADAEDVRRGLSLGAEAYLTKQKFDQRDLIATVGQLL